jgi:hypothetical protein
MISSRETKFNWGATSHTNVTLDFSYNAQKNWDLPLSSVTVRMLPQKFMSSPFSLVGFSSLFWGESEEGDDADNDELLLLLSFLMDDNDEDKS